MRIHFSQQFIFQLQIMNSREVYLEAISPLVLCICVLQPASQMMFKSHGF